MDNDLLILGGAVILLYLLSGKQTALGGVNIAALPGLAPGMAGGCVQPGCASVGAGGSPGGASPVSVMGAAGPAPAADPWAACPDVKNVFAWNSSGHAYIDPAPFIQACQRR